MAEALIRAPKRPLSECSRCRKKRICTRRHGMQYCEEECLEHAPELNEVNAFKYANRAYFNEEQFKKNSAGAIKSNNKTDLEKI